MKLLSRTDIETQLASKEDDSLHLDPLLEESQVGEVTIDLRLGYDFFVSVLTRKPYVGVLDSDRSIRSYFQQTRRNLGDTFVLYPNQVVLTTTVEYISLPRDVYADVLTRSSYTRLGIHVNTMVQPGFRGSVPIELFNHSNNAVELVVGSRMFQVRLFQIEEAKHYLEAEPRKYYGQVRPTISKADTDCDLEILKRIKTQQEKNNNNCSD